MSLDILRARHPWPADKPDVPPNLYGGLPQGWCDGDAISIMQKYTGPDTRLVMELGTWLGLSAWRLLDAAPNATVITADHFQGSAEHQGRSPEFEKLLPVLWETCCVNLWDRRDRVVPMRLDVVDAMNEVADLGLAPEFIWIDAAHDGPSVNTHMTNALRLFPEAVVAGHDYCWTEVGNTVNHLVRVFDLQSRFFANYTSWAIERPR